MAKSRSRNYPAIGLAEAMKRARELYDQDGKAAVASDVAVKAWGYGSINGASLRVLGALRQYGLLDDPAPKTVKLSPRALTILLEPPESAERSTAIRAAARAPAVFTELLDQYGSDIPSDAALISHLVRNANFSESAARSLIATFRANLELATDGADPDIADAGAPNPGDKSPHDGSVRRPLPPGRQREEGRMEFNWPLSGDTVATLTVSRTLEADDIETLAEYFEIAKKAMRKATRTATPPSEPPPAAEESA